MKKLLLAFFLFFSYSTAEDSTKKYLNYLQNLPTKTKKYRFYKLLLPPIKKVHNDLEKLYLQVKNNIEKRKNLSYLNKLKKQYKAKSYNELLKKIKPHPISITLAQAAMESGWGTSRFFVEANNIFGMWSKSKEGAIQAAQTRQNGKTIHLKRYNNLEEAIEAYYLNIARNSAYKKFQDIKFVSNDPYELVGYLDNYSEKKDLYTVELIKVIYYNTMTKYDI